MLTEHCRGHSEEGEKSADLGAQTLPVQFLASVSQANMSYVSQSLQLKSALARYSYPECEEFSFVSPPKHSKTLLVWWAERLKDRNREGGEDCVLLIMINYILISLATWKKWVFWRWRFGCVSCDFDVFHIEQEKKYFSRSWLQRKVSTIMFL